MDERPVALKGALWGLVALVAVLGLMHLWPDEAPLPETSKYRSLLDPKSTPKSWFYGAHGFLAEGDAFASGKRYVDALRLSGTADPDRHVAPDETLQKHYLELYAATDFANVMPPVLNSPLPRFDAIFKSQELLHAALLLEPDPDKALRGADEDLAYWRRVLADTNVLKSRMAAVRGASQALMLRGRLMEKLDEPALQSLPAVTALSPAETSAQEAIQFEMGIDYMVMQDLEKAVSEEPQIDPAVVGFLPMKPNATFNRHQQNHAPILAMAALPAAELARAHASLPAALHAVGWRDRLLNGKGVWLLSRIDATQLFGQYIFAAHDLAAQIALVNLKQQLLAAGPGEGSLQQALATSSIRNPYQEQEAARWDETTSELVFDTRPGADGPHRLTLRVSLPAAGN